MEPLWRSAARPHRVIGGGQVDRALDGIFPLAAQTKGRDPAFLAFVNGLTHSNWWMNVRGTAIPGVALINVSAHSE